VAACSMNYLDILLILPLIFGAWKGFSKGFVIELFTLVALFLGLYAGIHLSDAVSTFLRNQAGITSEYMPIISFTVAFLAVGAMVYFAGKTFEKLIKIARMSLLNKVGGAAFGAFKWLLIIGAICVISESYDEKTDLISDETKENSLLFLPIVDLTTGMIPAFKESTIFLKNTLDNEELIQLDEQDDPQ
jgi:membrane protein required for colicin V production